MTNLSVLCTWVRNEVHKIDKFGEKIADLDSPGYYLSDDTKTKNSPLHHHINGFSDNSVHWCAMCMERESETEHSYALRLSTD